MGRTEKQAPSSSNQVVTKKKREKPWGEQDMIHWEDHSRVERMDHPGKRPGIVHDSMKELLSRGGGEERRHKAIGKKAQRCQSM